MKIASATATAIAVVILLCALSMGGQQQENQQSPSSSREPRASRRGKATAKPQQWRMPDGRVVEFPASTSKEEIDALAKRIAEGAVELPPDARVVGWEPVEGAYRLLPSYEQRVATIPTVKGKLDALANAAVILQMQIDVTNSRIDWTISQIAALVRHHDELTNAVNLNAAVAGNADGRLLVITNQFDDLKRELNDFKDAACPVLRKAANGPRRNWDDLAGAMEDQSVQMKLDSVCGLH